MKKNIVIIAIAAIIIAIVALSCAAFDAAERLARCTVVDANEVYYIIETEDGHQWMLKNVNGEYIPVGEEGAMLFDTNFTDDVTDDAIKDIAL